MFTGIVEEKGKINSILKSSSSLVLNIKCSFASSLVLGESVAVNGTCLTVASKNSDSFTADVTPESFRRTSLGSLKSGCEVNLERAMKADGRFGGHIVSGHIDGTGIFVSSQNEQNAVNIKIAVSAEIGKFIIEKGSVCVDGISLTVASVNYGESETVFSVAVIPHTWKNTTLSKMQNGSYVNIECDLVGKYIEHFVNYKNSKNADDEEKSLENFMTSFTSFH